MAPKPSKFSYTNKKQVKINKPKPPKFGYTHKSQVKITKPAKLRIESLTYLARNIIFEAKTAILTVIHPKTKKRIKVLSALGYEKTHPAYKAAIALLNKKHITLPANLHAVKKGEQIPLFNLKPYEVPSRKSIAQLGSALAEDGAEEHLKETQYNYLSNLPLNAREGIISYTASGYSWINSFLRGNQDHAYDSLQQYLGRNESGEFDEDSDLLQSYMDDRIHDDTKNLDKAFTGSGAVLQEDILTYRGITEDSGILEEVLEGGVGTIIEDSGFVSTSIDSDVGHKFGAGEIVFKILARKGTRAIFPVAGNLGVQEEKELILNRGTKMRIISIDKKNVKNPDYRDSGGMKVTHILTVETIINGEKK